MSYAVLVNSTDSFEDCWDPFFKLFALHWPNCNASVWLNTETRRYRHPDVPVQCTEVGAELAKGKQCWSASLIEALQRIEETHVLYLQDDYFLNGPVRADVILRLRDVMEDEDIAHILLQRKGGVPSPGPFPGHPDLFLLPRKAGYYFSLQAGLWDRQAMLSCLKAGEDAWTAERRGTRRARKLKQAFCFASPEQYGGEAAIFPYVPTGIVGGRWYRPAVVELFEREGIELDFSRRGFFDASQLNSPRARLRRAVRRIITRF